MIHARLNVNEVFLYGNNLNQNVGWDNIQPIPGLAFGTIYGIWNGGDCMMSIGERVLVKDEPVCRVAWDNGEWSVYNSDKIIMFEKQDSALP